MNYQIKLSKFLKKRVTLVLLVILAWSCENDEVLEEVNQEEHTFKTVTKSEAQNVFNSFQKKREKIIKNSTKSKHSFLEIVPNWDSFNAEHLTFTDALLSTTEITTNAITTLSSRLIFLEIDGRVIRVIKSTQVDSQIDNGIKDGIVYYHNLDGEFIIGYRVENSKVTKRLVIEDNVSKASFFNIASFFTTDCVEGLDPDVEFCTQNLTAVTLIASSNQEEAEDATFIFFSDLVNREFGIDPHDYEGGDHTGGSGSGPSPSDGEGDDRIDDDELTEKEKCLNEHLNKKGDSFVKDILNKFQGESEFDIKIVSKNKVFKDGVTNGDGVNGITKYVLGSSLINIEISTTKLSNMPALAATRTLIHEYIHADMYRKLNTKYPTQGDLDFKKTYEEFETGNFQASSQHESMAELYVHSIKYALKDFHKNVLTGDYNYLTDDGINPLPDTFYEALAWQGLKDHNVTAYIDLPDSKKTELTSALNTYYHSTTKNCPQ